MGELSTDEKKQLCEDFKAYQKKMKPSDAETLQMTCQAKSAVSMMNNEAKDDASLRAACKKELESCVAKKEKMPEPELDCSSPEFLGKMGECKQITVGEIGECVKDMAGVMKRLVTEDLCGGLTVADKTAVMKIFDKLKSDKCEALEARCKGTAGPNVQPNTTGTPNAKLEQETIASLTEFKQRMCACKDQACGETVRAEMSSWGERMAKQHTDFKPSDSASNQVKELVNDYTNCMLKVAGEPAPPPMQAPIGRAATPK